MTTNDKTPKGCLPFDLGKARTGHPCRTRDGSAARLMCEMTNEVRGSYPVTWDISVDRPMQPITTTTKGSYMPSGISGKDIFLTAPKLVKREGWANVFKAYFGADHHHQARLDGAVYETHADAQKGKKAHITYLATIEIEWEEISH